MNDSEEIESDEEEDEVNNLGQQQPERKPQQTQALPSAPKQQP